MLLAVQFLMGIVIAAFGWSTTPLVSYVLIFLGGISFMALFSMSFSIVQLAVPEALRGRVVSEGAPRQLSGRDTARDDALSPCSPAAPGHSWTTW